MLLLADGILRTSASICPPVTDINLATSDTWRLLTIKQARVALIWAIILIWPASIGQRY